MIDIKITVQQVYLDRKLVHIPTKYAQYFPITSKDKPTCDLTIELDGIPEKVKYYSPLRGGPGIRNFGLTKWFGNHSKLKSGSILKLSISDSTPQYKLTVERV